MNGPAVAVELSNQHAVVISCQLQVVLSSEIITLKLHRFLLSVFSLLFFTRMCDCEPSRLDSGGHNETACGPNNLSGDPG